jgi:integrase
VLDYDVIEAFCVTGLAGRAGSTRGTYRSALYRLARPVHGKPGQQATPFAGARAALPYSPAERAELAGIAAAQRDPAKRASALAVVVFGIGAGLRPGELVALRGSEVSRRGRQVMVRVSGPAARVVPVSPGYAGRAAGLAAAAGDGHPFRPGPARRTAATRTSSRTSPALWPLTRPRPG